MTQSGPASLPNLARDVQHDDKCMQVAVTYILFQALRFFDSIVTSRAAPDLPAMLEGLGPQNGLAKLFKQLAGITMLLSIVQLAEAFLPPALEYFFGTSLGSAWSSMVQVALGVLETVA